MDSGRRRQGAGGRRIRGMRLDGSERSSRERLFGCRPSTNSERAPSRRPPRVRRSGMRRGGHRVYGKSSDYTHEVEDEHNLPRPE